MVWKPRHNGEQSDCLDDLDYISVRLYTDSWKILEKNDSDIYG